MEKFVIDGRRRLSGEVTPSGNKNESLPVLAATLLTEEPVILDNLPRIRDVLVMCDVIVRQGGEVEWLGPNRVKICTANVSDEPLDSELCQRIRASILFAGPMVTRFGQVVLPPPGGDVIGRRRLDTHFHAFEALGAQVNVEGNYEVRAGRLVGADIFLDEASVTATENAIMAASLAKGTTILRNAACEPHVCALARMINSMGGQIEGIGTNTLIIQGVDRLHGCEHKIESDYLEIGSFIGLAAVTRSPLTINEIQPDNLRMIRMVFERLGVRTELEGNKLHVPEDQPMNVRLDYHGHVPRVDDAIWPAFPTDLMSIAITVATQCRGTVLFLRRCLKAECFLLIAFKA